MKIGGGGEIIPEMLKANIDDVVAWTFDKHKRNDVYMLNKDECVVSYKDKQGKKGGKKYEVDEGSRLDTKTLAGKLMKPRSVMREFRII